MAELDGAEAVVQFAAVLRRHGLEVAVGNVTLFGRALATIGLARRSSAYWAARVTLVHRPEDLAAFDRAFAEFWDNQRFVDDVAAAPAATVVVTGRVEGAGPGPGYSRVEVLAHKDFAAYTSAESAEADRLMADLRLAAALRTSRRTRIAPRARRGRPDLRTTTRHALGTGGEPVRLSFRARAQQPRRIVLLCDVSGSMDPYVRPLLRLIHAAVVAGGPGRVEAFALGTRLTRITRELAWRDPDVALSRASRAAPDRAAGTRLGEGLREFNERWGVRGMARGATVVVLSDGWDRGDPDLLGEQMARLHRVAHLVVWVNPLKASPGYAPLARGMAAALPWVDRFVEGHSLASLEALAIEVVR